MNNNNAPPLPPQSRPSPAPAAGPHPSSSQQRRHVQVPSITTTLSAAQRFGSHLQPGTPVSARSAQTPASPQIHSPYSTYSSSSMASVRVPSNISTYNPQEWRRGGPVSGSYMPHTSQPAPRHIANTREATGMEGEFPTIEAFV